MAARIQAFGFDRELLSWAAIVCANRRMVVRPGMKGDLIVRRDAEEFIGGKRGSSRPCVARSFVCPIQARAMAQRLEGLISPFLRIRINEPWPGVMG